MAKKATSSKATDTLEPTEKKKPGRPAGAENRAYDTADSDVTRCAKCQSTERSPYSQRRATDFHNTHLQDGKPYNRIVYRSCHCLQCGQHRRDRTFELVEKSNS